MDTAGPGCDKFGNLFFNKGRWERVMFIVGNILEHGNDDGRV